MSEASVTVWAGFWRRVGGFLLDTLILGAVGLVAGLAFGDQLSAMSGPTRLVGLAVGLLYHGFLTSGAGGGRTLGMRVVGLKVARLNGKPLGLVRAFWRALLLNGPFTLNGMYFPIEDERLGMILGVPLMVLVFGVPIAHLILLLFNRPSGRLVHDLFSGAIVVRAAAREIPPVRSVGAIITAILVMLAVAGVTLALIYGLVFGGLKTLIPTFTRESLGDLTAVRAEVARLPGVMEAGVNDNVTTFPGGRTHTLIVTAKVAAMPSSPQPLVDQIGGTATRLYKLAPDQRVRVVLMRGFDIGIATYSTTQSFDYVPPAPRPAAPATPAPVTGT